MFGTSNIPERSLASPSDIRRAFCENRAELEWLGHFITGDLTLGKSCVSEACSVSLAQNSVFHEWLSTWARHATIRCAIDTQRNGINQISSNYRQVRLIRQVHEPLKGEALEFVINNTELLIANLDVICRTTLAVCGVQGKSASDAALLLGISLGGVQAAYSASMNFVEATRYRHATHDDMSIHCERA